MINGFCLYFSAWLQNQESAAVARLSRMIEAATNLTMQTAEDLQVIIVKKSSSR
jgi:hypothetical protein